MRNLRHRREKEAAAEKLRKPADHDQHLQELLDQELQTLPDRYRRCHCSLRSGGPHHRGRRQGVKLPARDFESPACTRACHAGQTVDPSGADTGTGAVAAALAQNLALASVPLPLVTSTVKAAGLVAAGQAAAGAIVPRSWVILLLTCL